MSKSYIATEHYYQKRQKNITDKEILTRGKYYANRLVTLFPELTHDTNKTILDAGCGSGSLLFGLSEILKRENNLIGLDITQAAIDRAKKYAINHSIKSIQFIQGNVLDIPLPDESVDIVISDQVVEHVIDPSKHISEAYRVLKGDGLLFIATAPRLFPWEFHLNFPFIPWFSKTIAQRILRLVGKTGQADYYEHVFPITTHRLNRVLILNNFETEYRGDRWLTKDFLSMLPNSLVFRTLRAISPPLKFLSSFQPTKILFQYFFPYLCFVAKKK